MADFNAEYDLTAEEIKRMGLCLGMAKNPTVEAVPVKVEHIVAGLKKQYKYSAEQLVTATTIIIGGHSKFYMDAIRALVSYIILPSGYADKKTVVLTDEKNDGILSLPPGVEPVADHSKIEYRILAQTIALICCRAAFKNPGRITDLLKKVPSILANFFIEMDMPSEASKVKVPSCMNNSSAILTAPHGALVNLVSNFLIRCNSSDPTKAKDVVSGIDAQYLDSCLFIVLKYNGCAVLKTTVEAGKAVGIAPEMLVCQVAQGILLHAPKSFLALIDEGRESGMKIPYVYMARVISTGYFASAKDEVLQLLDACCAAIKYEKGGINYYKQWTEICNSRWKETGAVEVARKLGARYFNYCRNQMIGSVKKGMYAVELPVSTQKIPDDYSCFHPGGIDLNIRPMLPFGHQERAFVPAAREQAKLPGSVHENASERAESVDEEDTEEPNMFDVNA